METVIDPGHELGDPAWDFKSGAVRKTVGDAFAGSWVSEVTLRRGASPVDGRFGQQINLLDLTERAWLFAYRRILGATADFRVHAEIYDGHVSIAAPTGTPYLTFTRHSTQDALGVWVQSLSPLTTPPSDQATIIARTQFVGGPFDIGTARWEFDSWSFPDTVSAENHMKWEVLSGLVTRLKAINGGATYHNDLSNRVYTRELFPDDYPDVKLPFITIVERPASYPSWQRGVEAEFGVFVRGFVADSSPNPWDTSTMQELAEIHDDIWNTLMTDQTLGGKVHDLVVNAVDAPPQGKGRQWAGVEFDLTMKVFFQQSELAP